jgi:hypothetical protein
MGSPSHAFWYKLLDLIHYGQVNLTSPRRGFMVFTCRDWLNCFYRERDEDYQDNAGKRAWERFKKRAREESGIIVNLPDLDSGEENAVVISRITVSVAAACDALYYELGPPHPLGLVAQLACDRDTTKAGALTQTVVHGIAAAALVEQRRRQAG